MKKINILKPLLATLPVVSPVAMLSSCGRVNYFKLAQELKTIALEEFVDIAKCQRGVWQDGLVFNQIKKRMSEIGYEPVAYDDWSSQNFVIDTAKEQLADRKDEKARYKEMFAQGDAAYGNIWYDIPASEGCESFPKVMIQAHMDTELEYPDGYTEWCDNGIDVYEDEENNTLYSNNHMTSLGADDGIGVAALIGIARLAKNNSFSHGPIRLLFTPDESGVANDDTDPDNIIEYSCGAHYLAYDQEKMDLEERPFGAEINANNPPILYVISLDGTIQGEITTSASGITELIYSDSTDKTTGNLVANEFTYTENDHKYKLEINGLKGGSSYADINSGYASALQILSYLLAADDKDFNIIDISCSDGAFSIPTAASAQFTSSLKIEDIKTICNKYLTVLKHQYPAETEMDIEVTELEKPTSEYVLVNDSSSKLITFMNILKFGPYDWFDSTKTRVKTSCNFSQMALTRSDDGKSFNCSLHITCRSSDQDVLDDFESATRHYFDIIYGPAEQKPSENHFTVNHNPVWEPTEDTSGNVMYNLISGIQKHFRYEVIKDDSHGWVEVACFPDIVKKAFERDLHMTVIGPTIETPHTRYETLYTRTLDSVYKTLLYALINANVLED